MTFTNNYKTGSEVSVYFGKAGRKAVRNRGVVVAGPVQEYCGSGLVMLSSKNSPELDYVMNVFDDLMALVPVQPDGMETGTEVSIKCAQNRWLTGHIIAGPLAERAAGLALVLTEHGHVQHLSTSRLFPY